MGSCCSSPETKYEARPPASEQRTNPSNGAKPPAPTTAANSTASAKRSVPDFGLSSTHEVIKMLGKGGEGETWLCKERNTGHEVAIKLIRRPIPKLALNVIKREIKIQADLGQGHMNIVSADEVILSKSHLGLVMEYVPGGNMVSYVTKKRETKHERGGLCMDEDEARYYFVQLVSAVEYCHKNNVAHRDLKLDNTLLDSHKTPWLKLCDFGFAKHWSGGNSNMDTMRIGTPEYMGPELISGRTGYDGKKVDVWAAGVLLYVMLVGMFPFETQDDCNNTAGLYDIWLQQIKTSWRDLPNNSSAAVRLSPELKDLLDKMFEVKQDLRLDIAAVKDHPWFKKPLAPKYAAALEDLRQDQQIIDDQVKKGVYASPERDKLLEMVLDKAAQNQMVTPDDPIRVSLAKVKRSQSVNEFKRMMLAAGQATIKEEA